MRSIEQQGKRLAFYVMGLSLNEKRGITTHVLPANWASYLINGDSSGMEDQDIQFCDSCTADLGSCLTVSERTHFGVFRGIGYELAEYKFRKN